MDKEQKRRVWAWVSYDMGNSVFSVTVMAGFFPIFFKSYWSQGVSASVSTARLGISISLISLVAALLAPFLGAYSDFRGIKRKSLLWFACFGVFNTALLGLIGPGRWEWSILAYSGAVLGFYLANVFYDSLLVTLVEPARRDWVSSLGYSFGYLSGGVIFAFCILMTLDPKAFGLQGATGAVKISFGLAAFAWALGAGVCAFGVKEGAPINPKVGSGLALSWKQLKSGVALVRSHRTIWMFLLSYWLYIDVVNTLVVMAVDYGMSLGFQSEDLIVALLMVQLIGFPAALAVAKLGQGIGPRKAILFCLAVYGFVCGWAIFLTEKWEFFALAGLIGLTQGGIQALSRSYYANLIPPDQGGEFFGFYNMLGKFASILGPLLVGAVGLSVHFFVGESGFGINHLDSRLGFGVLFLPLFLGGWIFLKIPPNKPAC